MSWWTSVALPAISKTVDPTGTLAKAVGRVTASGASGSDVARAFLDPLNVTKYVAKKKTTTTSSGEAAADTTASDLTTEATALISQYWPYLLVAAVVLYIFKRR